MGPQKLRVSNADTGKSTFTLLDGILVYDFAGDGSFTITALGKNIAAFRPTDDFPAGIYFIDGYHITQYQADFAAPRQLTAAIGVEINYCETLSGPRHHH